MCVWCGRVPGTSTVYGPVAAEITQKGLRGGANITIGRHLEIAFMQSWDGLSTPRLIVRRSVKNGGKYGGAVDSTTSLVSSP
jgi:hypothetical protein